MSVCHGSWWLEAKEGRKAFKPSHGYSSLHVLQPPEDFVPNKDHTHQLFPCGCKRQHFEKLLSDILALCFYPPGCETVPDFKGNISGCEDVNTVRRAVIT